MSKVKAGARILLKISGLENGRTLSANSIAKYLGVPPGGRVLVEFEEGYIIIRRAAEPERIGQPAQERG